MTKSKLTNFKGGVMNFSNIFVPILLGIGTIFIYSVVMAQIEKRKREKGFVPEKYEDKLPYEYNEAERKHTLYIGLFMLFWFLIMLVFILTVKKYAYIGVFFMPLGLLIWKFLIKKGNKLQAGKNKGKEKNIIENTKEDKKENL